MSIFGTETPRFTSDAERDRDEMMAFLMRVSNHGGSIVSTASLSTMEISAARATDRMLVLPNGLGFVHVPEQKGIIGMSIINSDAIRRLELYGDANPTKEVAVKDQLTEDCDGIVAFVREEIADIDPGVRILVSGLRRLGWATTDSGDGYSKAKEDQTIEGAHVCIRIGSIAAVQDAMQNLIDNLEKLFEVSCDYEITVSYSSMDGLTVLILCGVDDNHISKKMGAALDLANRAKKHVLSPRAFRELLDEVL
jgi:hypothetical protein